MSNKTYPNCYQKAYDTASQFIKECRNGIMEPYKMFIMYYTMRTNLPKTLDQMIFCKLYTLNLSKFTKCLVNVLKFTKYSVNSYHQKGVKHYVLTN